MLSGMHLRKRTTKVLSLTAVVGYRQIQKRGPFLPGCDQTTHFLNCVWLDAVSQLKRIVRMGNVGVVITLHGLFCKILKPISCYLSGCLAVDIC